MLGFCKYFMFIMELKLGDNLILYKYKEKKKNKQFLYIIQHTKKTYTNLYKA